MPSTRSSSGMSATRPVATTGPTPGIDVSTSIRPDRTGSVPATSAISSSNALICLPIRASRFFNCRLSNWYRTCFCRFGAAVQSLISVSRAVTSSSRSHLDRGTHRRQHPRARRVRLRIRAHRLREAHSPAPAEAGQPTVRQWSRWKRLTLSVFPLCLFMFGLLATLEAERDLAAEEGQYVVVTKDGKPELSDSQVLRSLAAGVLVRVPSEDRIRFIPWDNTERVERKMDWPAQSLACRWWGLGCASDSRAAAPARP